MDVDDLWRCVVSGARFRLKKSPDLPIGDPVRSFVCLAWNGDIFFYTAGLSLIVPRECFAT